MLNLKEKKCLKTLPKISKANIKLGDIVPNSQLDKSKNSSSSVKNGEGSTFLINYYSRPLFNKASRLNVEQLTELLKEKTKEDFLKNNQDAFTLDMRKKLSNKDFPRDSILQSIYAYEEEYFKKAYKYRSGKNESFNGSLSYNIKTKFFRDPKTTLRYESEMVDMVKNHLFYYYKNNYKLSTEQDSDEIVFTPSNDLDPALKDYQKSINNKEGYLYINFSKRNLFLTLTDMNGNCIKNISSGSEGFKRRERQRPFAARQLAVRIAREAVSNKYTSLILILNPHNRRQRWRLKPIMQTLELQGIRILRVQRKVVQAHGGCRKKKSRRI